MSTQLEVHTLQQQTPEELRQQRLLVAGLVIGGLVALAAVIAAVIFLLADPARTATIRDILVIGLAVLMLLIGLTLIILLVQVARLVNMVQNEVRPVLDSANAALNTLRGTVEFLSDNLSEPVIRLNSYLAGFRKVWETVQNLRKSF